MRRHHEELAAAPALVTAVTALIPFSVAIWIRVKEWRACPTVQESESDS